MSTDSLRIVGFYVHTPSASMELVIAEKPSVARDLARVLGATRRGDGCLEGPHHVVTWCVGHLIELDEPAAYDPLWKPWRAETLPMLPQSFKLRPSRTSATQWKVVRALLRDTRFSAVINACDAGREGELIFRWCYQLAGARLNTKRLWVSSLTDAAIRAGFAALKPGTHYDALADAARCRAESDWLVGLNATRALTLRQRRHGRGDLLSVGRVQTPTLALVVAREKAVRAFSARAYWELQGRFTPDEGGTFTARWTHDQRSALDTAALATALRERCDRYVKTSGRALVEDVSVRKQKVPPPLLFDLTSLQRTANARYGLSAQRTLDVAQSLYETHKFITYPRTDSRHLSDDLYATLDTLFGALEHHAPIATYAAQVRASRPAKSLRVFNQAKVSDHHAIIPTAKVPIEGATLERDAARIYELIVRRFLGAFMPDAVFELTSMLVSVGASDGRRVEAPPPPQERQGDGEADTVETETRFVKELPPPPDRFVAQGRARLVAGWQEVAFEENEPKGLQRLPTLRTGQTLDGDFSVDAKRTQPPRRYTEATLLAAMESAGRTIDDEVLRAAMRDSGLGTPATRAAVLETLFERKYVRREGKSLVATEMGEGLIDALPVAALRSPELTGQWESRLARMARGDERREDFMRDIAGFVREAVQALQGAPRVPTSTPVQVQAPAPVSRRRARVRTRVPGAAVSGLRCPTCGVGAVIVGNRAWGCSRWREGCGFVFPFEREGKPVSDAALRRALRTGVTTT
jgi:DNA topoisomerase-3